MSMSMYVDMKVNICWIGTLTSCTSVNSCCRSPRCWIAGLVCSIKRDECKTVVAFRGFSLSVQSHERTSLKPLTANRTQDSRWVFYGLRDKASFHLFQLSECQCVRERYRTDTYLAVWKYVNMCVWAYVYNLSLSSHLFLETIGSVPSRHWTEGGRDKAAVLCSELTFHSDTNGRTHNFTNCPSWPAAQTEWISSANPNPAMCIWHSTDKAFPHNRAEKCYINTSREKERERDKERVWFSLTFPS